MTGVLAPVSAPTLQRASTAAWQDSRLSIREAHELVARAGQRRRREVVEHEIEAEDVGGIDTGCPSDLAEEGTLLEVSQPGDGGEVRVGIQDEALGVDPPIEVDGQLGDAGDRPIQPDQHLLEAVTGPKRQTAGTSEVPVQP
jgi:hypothetical protein